MEAMTQMSMSAPEVAYDIAIPLTSTSRSRHHNSGQSPGFSPFR